MIRRPSKAVPGEWAAARNLKTIRKTLLGLPRTFVCEATGLSPKNLSRYENVWDFTSPKVSDAVKLCGLYGVSLGSLCRKDYHFFWNGSPEAFEMLVGCLSQFEGIDLEKHKNEAIECLEKYRMPCSEYLVKSVLQESLRRAVAEGAAGPAPRAVEDKKLLENMGENFKRLAGLGFVQTKKLVYVTGLSQGIINSALRGEDVTLSVLLKLSDFFGVNPSEVIKEEPDFGDEGAIIADVALGPKNEHPVEIVAAEAVAEYNRQVENILSFEDAKEMIEKAFSEIENNTFAGGNR
ncbi:MAG: helix-turn-helix transcriptional regulator [Bacteroidales bacterium]|nr:helix-turn-helix transcriptional regulator [Bacteroidales bacterium]